MRRKGQAEQSIVTRSTTDQPEESGPATGTPPNPIEREPVVAGTALVGAGTAALALFAGNELGGETIGLISAGAVTVGGILLRLVVTPLANPKDAQRRKLTPS